MIKQIAIIGAGPVGCYAAYLLAKKGFEVDLFDQKRKSRIGEPIQCTGIFSSDIRKFVPLDQEFLVNTIKKIKIISPNQQNLTLNKTEYVFDRSRFDKYLLGQAIKQGVMFHPQQKLVKLHRINNQVALIFQNKNFLSDLVIGADGPNSMICSFLNPKIKKKFYYGIQAVVKGNFQSDTYQVLFGRKICPKFFAWLVPESKNRARLGLAALSKPSFHFNRLLTNLNIKPNQILEKQGGLIPVFNSKLKTNSKNIFLLGDAASGVKATTGGGIVPAFEEARKLVKALSDGKKPKNNSKNLKRHIRIRRILNRFSDRDYNQLVNLLSKPKNKKILETSSRENPGKLLAKLLVREPGLLRFIKHFW